MANMLTGNVRVDVLILCLLTCGNSFYLNYKVYLRRNRYTFKNGQGMEVDVITFGCYITSIRVPDRDGQLSDVALGFGKLSGNNFSSSNNVD